MLQQYHDVSDEDGREANGIHELNNSEGATSQPNRNILQRITSFLDELDLDQFTIADIAALETELQIALIHTRATKLSLSTQQLEEQRRRLQDQVKLLREENELLKQEKAAMVTMNMAAEEMDDNREVSTELNKLAKSETDCSPP